MLDTIKTTKEAFETELASVESTDSLEQLQIRYLGRKGKLNDLFSSIKNENLTPEQIREFGTQVNELKTFVSTQIQNKQSALHTKSDSDEWVDTTLPGTPLNQLGSLHMVTHAVREIKDIFAQLGFIQMSYPEVEWEHFAFEVLNMPKTHPARDDFETFFLDTDEHPEYGKMLLTPHTSSGQVREMLRVKTPPIKMINISRCYRPNWDTTHVPMFHQFEGVCIDTNITIADLKGTIEFFAQEYFGSERKIRLRPYNFRFTEPSFEVDITCDICGGTGKDCKVCKAGWLELGGAGMIHPFVLKSGDIDPEKYSGWAFGFGIERVAMMKSGLNMDDLRIIYNGNVQFLEQF